MQELAESSKPKDVKSPLENRAESRNESEEACPIIRDV